MDQRRGANHFPVGGGSYRLRSVMLLASLLALASADQATVGAVAPELQQAFHIGNTQIGLLASVFSIVAGLATVPVGIPPAGCAGPRSSGPASPSGAWPCCSRGRPCPS